MLTGDFSLPGDKSISHRALMLLSIAAGSGTIQNLSNGQDVLSTLNCMKALGVDIRQSGESGYRIQGQAYLKTPEGTLDCGNSGTTIRLLSGLLCGAGIEATLTGDTHLQKRPMKRILKPLQQMGGHITATQDHAPIQTQARSSGIKAIHYAMPLASAQVKSAILMAGLWASHSEEIEIEEPLPSRDHTERMLSALGALVSREEHLITLVGRQPDLIAQDIFIPGDFSSAAFWMVGAAIVPDACLVLRQVSLNPTRTGLLSLLNAIGENLQIQNLQERVGEAYGDIHIKSMGLKGNIEISSALIPSLIDEIPILIILGLFTDGVFTLRGAEELRYKESDRLQAMVDILQSLNVDVETTADGLSFQGNPNWQVPKLEIPLKTHHDHRLVMALEILNLKARYPLPIMGKEWVTISYPEFYATLEKLKH
jgi:3-phosphoshikimate 1-carboxyvinyltransferase